MGFDSRSATVAGVVSAHNSARDCEEAALWYELEQRTAAIAAEPRYAPINAYLCNEQEPPPVWTLDDWRTGKPCAWGERHQHNHQEAPPPVRDGVEYPDPYADGS